MQARDPAIIVRSTAGVIIGWNEAAERLLGYTARDVVGESYGLVMPQDEDPTRALAERICVRRDGQRMRAMCRRGQLTDGADQVVATFDVLSPLEELPKLPAHDASPLPDGLVERLRAERERLESVVASSPGVVLTYRLTRGRVDISFLSSASQEMYGYSPAQIEADPTLIIARIPNSDALRLRSAQDESARNEQPWHAVFRYLHPSGELKWLEGRTRPTRGLDGSLVWNGVIIDVTSRKQAEDELSILQAQLETALDATGMGAWLLDFDKQKVWGNETTRTLWEVPGNVPPWYEIHDARARIHPDDGPRVKAERDRAIASGGLMHTECRVLRADGSERWFSIRARVQAEGGRPRRLAGVQLDITPQKQAEESALRTSKLEALGTLAGGVAHDFNNVLFAITGNAALTLAELPSTSPVRAYVEQIAAAADRATDLVRKILAFSRPEQQQRSTIPLSEVVESALALVRASTPAMIEIASDLDPSARIVADRSRVEQIVVNLCSNAVHAIGKGKAGRIDITVTGRVAAAPESGTSPGDFAVLTVSDDGCGMDTQTRGRIFDPFFTTRGPGEGTGLGLSVVHSFVRALDGHVTVSSQPGRGSTFRVLFPAAREPEPPLEMRVPVSGHGQRILFVDDEPMLVQLAESMLEVLGYEASVFQEPARALEAFRAAPGAFTAVITDLSMPGMSGFDLSRALLALRPDLPILVMSGYVGGEERKAAERLGVRELVLKPVTMAKLRELLAALCAEPARRN